MTDDNASSYRILLKNRGNLFREKCSREKQCYCYLYTEAILSG